MSAGFNLKKNYVNHLGLDFKSTDLVRPDGFSSSMKNAQYKRSGAIETRNGYQAVALDRIGGDRCGGFGMFSYNRVAPFDIINQGIFAGNSDQRLVSLNKNAYELKETQITIQYNGASDSINASLIFDTVSDQYVFQILDTGTDTVLISYDLGKGIDEAIPVTVLDLKTYLDANLGGSFTTPVIVTGDSAVPAAFLRIKRNANIPASGGSIVFDAYYWEEIRSTIADPFNGSYIRKNSDTFENISSVQLNNVIYFSNGYDYVMKYDGTFMYRAGLPTPDTDVNDKTNTISLFTQGTDVTVYSGLHPELYYSYKIQYEQQDNAGNIYAGNYISKQFKLTATSFGTVSPAYSAAAAPFSFACANTLTVGDDIIFKVAGGDYVRAIVGAGTTGATLVLDTSAPDAIISMDTGAEITSLIGDYSIANNTVIYKSNSAMNVRLPTVVTSRGFNTNYALVNGNQAGVTTITVTAPHPFQTKDVVVILDTAGSTEAVRAEVIGHTSTTITLGNITGTVSGNTFATVDVLNGQFIVNGLSILIWRSKGFDTAEAAAAANHYLVAASPNIPTLTQQGFTDNFADFQIFQNALFEEPLVQRDPPPKGKYLASYRNNLIIANLLNDSNGVAFSDTFSEYFDPGRNRFLVESVNNDNISGVASNNNVLCVFKDDSIHTVSGDLNDLNFRVEPLINDLGATSHASIQEVDGSLYFLSDGGPYKMLGGQLPTSVGENRIEPVFVQSDVQQEQKFKLKRALSFNDSDTEKWILFIPAETGIDIDPTAGEDLWKYNNENSRVFVCDYNRPDVWLEWNNYDISGGAALYRGEQYFMGRVVNSDGTDIQTYLFRKLNNNDSMDYQDNVNPITWEYDSNWESLGEPSVFKKFHRLRLFSLEENQNNELDVNVKTEVNYIKDNAKSDFNFTFDSLGYGFSAYGSSAYGDAAELAEYRNLAHGKFRSMRVRFSNSDPQKNTIITGWELEIAPPYKQQFKK